MLTPEVRRAIDEIASAFPHCRLDAEEDGQGGARVLLDDVELGAPYAQQTSWFGFHITHTYPYADVYPHFVRADLNRIDGKPLGDGTSNAAFRNRPAVQLSRRSNRLDATADTALLKLQKVILWLMSR